MKGLIGVGVAVKPAPQPPTTTTGGTTTTGTPPVLSTANGCPPARRQARRSGAMKTAMRAMRSARMTQTAVSSLACAR